MNEDARFARAVDFTIAQEGGARVSNHSADPGGLTKYGISIVFAGSIKLDLDGDGETTPADIYALTRDKAETIYFSEFWRHDRLRCDLLPAGLGLLAFDAGVNMGPSRSARFIQKAVGATPDGWLGPSSRARIAARVGDGDGLADVLSEASARRAAFYGRLSTFKHFGLGWSRRNQAALLEALRAAFAEGNDLRFRRAG